jgi:hypothetical protein
VPFSFPDTSAIPPTFRNGFIDHFVVLDVSVDIPWAFDPSFQVALTVLPQGSAIHGDTSRAPIGHERLRRIASAIAETTGLPEGDPPVLVEGSVGPVKVRITDAPRGGTLGVEADLSFPSTELDIEFRQAGMLDRLRPTPLLLPAELREHYFLRCAPENGPDADALARFFGQALGILAGAEVLRFSDHHLGLRVRLLDDELMTMTAAARFVVDRAQKIADAIAALPFRTELASSRAAWEATATEKNAVLVPSGPALHGLTFSARIFGGEERAITASVRTLWEKDAGHTRVDIDLRDATVPSAASGALDAPSELLDAVRKVFPMVDVRHDGLSATLERPEVARDPRTLFSGIETFLLWVLDARGERRADAPYR